MSDMPQNCAITLNTKEDQFDFGQLHSVLLEIVLHLDEICRDHNIPYYLTGGAALGAVRHKGFIPWDDDIDIMMLKKDYNRFLTVCRKDLDSCRFFLDAGSTDNRPIPNTKIRRNGTKIVEHIAPVNRHHNGIFVDVFPLYPVRPSYLGAVMQWLSSRLVVAKCSRSMGERADRIIKILAYLVADLIPERLVEFLKKYICSSRYEQCLEVANFYHRGRFKENRVAKYMLGVPKYVPFEDKSLPVPEKVEEYLNRRFGVDWSKLPPPSKRVNTHVRYFEISEPIKDEYNNLAKELAD